MRFHCISIDVHSANLRLFRLHSFLIFSCQFEIDNPSFGKKRRTILIIFGNFSRLLLIKIDFVLFSFIRDPKLAEDMIHTSSPMSVTLVSFSIGEYYQEFINIESPTISKFVLPRKSGLQTSSGHGPNSTPDSVLRIPASD